MPAAAHAYGTTYDELPVEASRRMIAARTGTRDYPDTHAIAVAQCAGRVAEQIDPTGELPRIVVEGALLHDVGKLFVSDRILGKPGPLTLAERRRINAHPLDGDRIVRSEVAPDVADVVRAHHERWDGSGYPHGLSASQIPLAARVVAVADAFLAMIEERPYRPALSKNDALQELEEGAGTQFDPLCVAALVTVVGRDPR